MSQSYNGQHGQNNGAARRGPSDGMGSRLISLFGYPTLPPEINRSNLMPPCVPMYVHPPREPAPGASYAQPELGHGDKPVLGGIYIALYANNSGQSWQRFRWELYVQSEIHYGYSFALFQSSSTRSISGFSVVHRMERDILSAPGLVNLFLVNNADDRGCRWMFKNQLQTILDFEQIPAGRISRSPTHPPDYCWILENLVIFRYWGILDIHMNLQNQMSQMERHAASHSP